NLLIASQSISTEGNFTSPNLPISSNSESENSRNVMPCSEYEDSNLDSSHNEFLSVLGESSENFISICSVFVKKSSVLSETEHMSSDFSETEQVSSVLELGINRGRERIDLFVFDVWEVKLSDISTDLKSGLVISQGSFLGGSKRSEPEPGPAFRQTDLSDPFSPMPLPYAFVELLGVGGRSREFLH
ncbi:hypothetical protein IGI04_015897, partial [Brassica rapa subsp. trilocularis]